MFTVTSDGTSKRDGYERPSEICINGMLVKKAERDFGVRSKFFFEFNGKQYILKLDPENWEQGKKEHTLWNRLDEEDKQYFLPIIFYGQLDGLHFIIQEVVEFDHSKTREELQQTWNDVLLPVAQKYNVADACGATTEYNANDEEYVCGRNWDFVGNQPVIYDYGVIRGIS